MAQAAGIAEGTIFRVFPDKQRLIYEAVKLTMDPTPVRESIEAIRSSSPLESKVTTAIEALLKHYENVSALAELLRSAPAPSAARKLEGRRLIAESNAVISAALTAMLKPHGDELRVPAAKAVAALRGLVFASAHPLVPEGERLTIDDAVTILLSGITRRQDS
jgi:AcrR family transcriptional regulator